LRWAGDAASRGAVRNTYKTLVGKLEGKRPLQISRRIWENYIKMDLETIGCEMDSSSLGQEKNRGLCEHINETYVSIRGE
jgi:hypothetical protein